jgi:nitrate reductase assembly molybdenum cofactor insertion protein NarJ
MRPDVATHDGLATLLMYPRDRALDVAEQAAQAVVSGCPMAGEALAPFLDYMRAHPLGEIEETFTRTFDNSAERALEVGWHTFGENYTRGTFMVRMRQRLREFGVEENGELPDHLSHILPLLGRADARWSGDMAHDTVAPAVVKIRDALAEQKNPWEGVLNAVLVVLEAHERSAREPAGSWVPSSWPPAPSSDSPSSSSTPPTCSFPAPPSSDSPQGKEPRHD